MDYNRSVQNNTDTEESINIMVYAKKLLHNWWIIALTAICCALCGFIVAKVTYVPTYSSKIMFIANNKASSIAVAGQSASDLTASATLAESFKYVFKTTELSEIVAKNSGYKDVTVKDIKKWVSVEAIEETSIINLTVTTTQPGLSYGIAVAYVNNYSGAINNAFPNTTLTVIDPPLEPAKPDASNSLLTNTLLGFLLGAIVSAGLIIFAVMAKDSVKSADDIQNKLGLTIIGMVSRINKKGKKGEKTPILISDKRNGFSFIETYKIIRTKIEHAAAHKNYKTFMITSTAENEGKTTNATNLALALAKNGKSVLLIDGDLRKPAIAKALDINANDDLGLAGVITGEKTLAESIKYSEKYNLFLLISNHSVQDPSEMLSMPAMEEIIASAEKEFDYVIIDTAPSGIVADAAIIANYADAIVMVIRNDRAPIRRVKHAIENLENSGTEILGCIYNEAEQDMPKQMMTKYTRRYGYGYGYGSKSSK